MTMRPTTGDSPEAIRTQAVQLTQLGIVLKSDLTVESAMINQKALSGKQLGAAILGVDSLTTNANPVLYIAAGSEPDDAWIASSGAGGATVPPATTTVQGTVLKAATTAAFAATDVAGLVAEMNAFLTKYKAAGQG